MHTLSRSRDSADGGMNRRSAMSISGQAAMTLSLPPLLTSRAHSATKPESATDTGLPGFGKAKSVIVLWLLGGISQIESWDPKPKAPKEVRGAFGTIDSAVPGIHLGELLPQVAQVTNELTLLRAVVTRLSEAGVSLVHVNWTRIDGFDAEGAWDTHGDHSKCAKGFLMPMFDQTFSALISDLRDRGRLEDILVMAVSEFGRTPRFNRKAGRDHWGNCFSVALAGGGIRGGIVHGESDRIAGAPVSQVVSPADLIATMYYCLGLDPETIIQDTSGRPFPLSRGQVIREILA